MRVREVLPEPIVPSPCISICRMVVETALCEGCFRTIPEIAGWRRMGDDEKRAVWGLIEQRSAGTRTRAEAEAEAAAKAAVAKAEAKTEAEAKYEAKDKAST